MIPIPAPAPFGPAAAAREAIPVVPDAVLDVLRERLAVATTRHHRAQARRRSLADNGGAHRLVEEFRAREQAALDRVLDAEVALRDVELVLAGAALAAVSA